MDQLHRRLARLALAEAGAFGFCLAGGYAVQAHGFLDRPSEDVDLFTTTASEEHFSDALAAVVRAYEAGRLAEPRRSQLVERTRVVAWSDLAVPGARWLRQPGVRLQAVQPGGRPGRGSRSIGLDPGKG